MARFRNYFLTGLIVAGPDRHHAVSDLVVRHLGRRPGAALRARRPIGRRPTCRSGLPGAGLIIGIIALTMLGFLTANLVGRKLVDFGERLLGRMPVVRAIYRSLKQVFETLFSGQGSSFRRVGLVEFPVARHVVDRADLAAAERRDFQSSARHGRAHRRCSCHARRTRPPDSSSTCRRARSIEVEMSTEDAATLIMSAGVVQPGADAAEEDRSPCRHGQRRARRQRRRCTPAKVE